MKLNVNEITTPTYEFQYKLGSRTIRAIFYLCDRWYHGTFTLFKTNQKILNKIEEKRVIFNADKQEGWRLLFEKFNLDLEKFKTQEYPNIHKVRISPSIICIELRNKTSIKYSTTLLNDLIDIKDFEFICRKYLYGEERRLFEPLLKNYPPSIRELDAKSNEKFGSLKKELTRRIINEN